MSLTVFPFFWALHLAALDSLHCVCSLRGTLFLLIPSLVCSPLSPLPLLSALSVIYFSSSAPGATRSSALQSRGLESWNVDEGQGELVEWKTERGFTKEEKGMDI